MRGSREGDGRRARHVRGDAEAVVFYEAATGQHAGVQVASEGLLWGFCWGEAGKRELRGRRGQSRPTSAVSWVARVSRGLAEPLLRGVVLRDSVPYFSSARLLGDVSEVLGLDQDVGFLRRLLRVVRQCVAQQAGLQRTRRVVLCEARLGVAVISLKRRLGFWLGEPAVVE